MSLATLITWLFLTTLKGALDEKPELFETFGGCT